MTIQIHKSSKIVTMELLNAPKQQITVVGAPDVARRTITGVVKKRIVIIWAAYGVI